MPFQPLHCLRLPAHQRPRTHTTRTHRRAAAATGTAQPAVNHSFGPGAAPCSLVRRASTSPRAPRTRPPLAITADLPHAPTPDLTVPFPFDRDRLDPLGALLWRFPPPLPLPSPLRPTTTPSVLSPDFVLLAPPRIRTLTGNVSNLQSLPAMLPKVHFSQPVVGSSHRNFHTFPQNPAWLFFGDPGSCWQARVDSTPPTTASPPPRP